MKRIFSARTITGICSRYPRKYFVYGLLLADGSIYYGRTGTLVDRLGQHLTGCGAMQTIVNEPIGLIYLHECSSLLESKAHELKVHHAQRSGTLYRCVPARYRGLFTGIVALLKSYGYL